MRLHRVLEGEYERPHQCFTGFELGTAAASGATAGAGAGAAGAGLSFGAGTTLVAGAGLGPAGTALATGIGASSVPTLLGTGAAAGAAGGGGGLLSLLSFTGLALNLLGIGGQTAANVQSAEMRAQLAEREAASLRDAAIFNATQARRRSALAISKGVATGAASGLDVQFGSPLLFELDNVMQAEVEAQNIVRSGTVGATGKEFEAKLARSSIPGSIFSGVAQAGGSVLSSFIRRA